MINPNFVYVGIVLQLIGGGSYLIDTIRGRAKPNRVSWLLWSLAPLIAFFAEINQGVGSEAYATFVVGFVPLLVFISTFFNKKSQWKVEKLDIVCGVLSIVGLILWAIIRVGNIAIVFSILADGLASIPTVRKSWTHPESESILAYSLGIINAAIGLLVIKTWNFQNYSFLVYIFIINLIITLILQFKLGALFKKMVQ